MTAEEPVRIALADGSSVGGLWMRPGQATAAYVFGHGAGAGMGHAFMAAVAAGLAERGIATLRYQFPYMERGSRRVDPPAVAHAAVRAAVDEAARGAPELPLFAGGKSFGGRMSSQAQAASPLPGVRGLVFVGFPLHPAKQPGSTRGDHLDSVGVPMLFLQGTKDALAEMPLVEALVSRLGACATLVTFEHADHAFHVPARSGRTDAQVLTELLDATRAWMQRVVSAS